MHRKRIALVHWTVRITRHPLPLVMPVVACIICAASSGAVVATATSQQVRKIRPDVHYVVVGYHYACRSTSRTPNFSCTYGRPFGPYETPIITVYKGSRAMYIQSFRRPTVAHGSGGYDQNRAVDA